MATSITGSNAPRREWSVDSAVYERLLPLMQQYPFNLLHSVTDNLPNVGKTIKVPGFVDKVSAAANCNTTDTGTGGIVLTDVVLKPAFNKMRRSLCYTDLRELEGFQEGWSAQQPWELMANPEFVNFFATFFLDGFQLDNFRLLWLGDVAAALESGGGYIRAGKNPADYTLMDGLWTQIFAAGAGINRVNLSKNTLTTTALQTAYTGAEMIALLQDAITALEPQAYAKLLLDGGYFLVPAWWYKRIKQHYETISVTATGNAQGPIVNGNVEVGGVPLVPMPIWDLYVGSPQNNGDTSTQSGAALYYPNRFILTTSPSAMPVGFGYNPTLLAPTIDMTDNENTRFRAELGIAAKLGNTFMMSVGY